MLHEQVYAAAASKALQNHHDWNGTMSSRYALQVRDLARRPWFRAAIDAAVTMDKILNQHGLAHNIKVKL